MTNFLPGNIYAKLQDGKHFKFIEDDQSTSGGLFAVGDNRGGWSKYPTRHDYATFTPTPVSTDAHRWAVGDVFSYAGSAVKVLALLEDDKYLVSLKKGNSNNREEWTNEQIVRANVILNPDVSPEEEAPAPPVDVTALQEDAAGPYPESAERVAEVEATLKEHGIAFISVQQENHTSFCIKLSQAGWPRNLHEVTHKAGFTPYRTEFGKAWVHVRPADLAPVDGGLSIAADQHITELAAKAAGKDLQIAELTQEVANLKTMLEGTRKVVINGGVTGHQKQAFIRQDVTEAEYNQLLNDGRVTITATQFVIHPISAAPMFCVAGFRRVADEQPAPRIEAHKPVGGMASLGDVVTRIMTNAAGNLNAEVYNNGGQL